MGDTCPDGRAGRTDPVGDLSVQKDLWWARTENLDRPEGSPRPERQSLYDRLLGCETAGQITAGAAPLTGLGQLGLREYPARQSRVPGKGTLHPGDFDQIRSDTHGIHTDHTCSLRGWVIHTILPRSSR